MSKWIFRKFLIPLQAIWIPPPYYLWRFQTAFYGAPEEVWKVGLFPDGQLRGGQGHCQQMLPLTLGAQGHVEGKWAPVIHVHRCKKCMHGLQAGKHKTSESVWEYTPYGARGLGVLQPGHRELRPVTDFHGWNNRHFTENPKGLAGIAAADICHEQGWGQNV